LGTVINRLTGHEPVPPTLRRWYGLEPWWQIWVEATAQRQPGPRLHARMLNDRLVYLLPVEVRGRREPVLVTVTFYADPPYETYGLPPEEYPRVIADAGARSPHRMPGDNALCLYFPGSPPEQRWRPRNGLLALFDLARDHLFFEDYWRSTGGPWGGIWLGDQAPHGFPNGGAA